MRLTARTLLVLVGLWASSLPAIAQQPKRVRQSSTSSGSIGVRAELAAVLLQSGRYDEAAREYRVLLTREKMYQLAIVHFDTLLMRVPVGRIPDRGTLLRELADAYIAAGDRAGGAERIRAALALAPADTALRHNLATMLVDSRHFADAE